jgi:hypothetical protein
MATKVTPYQQIKSMRLQLEVAIMALVTKFQKESGMEVCSVDCTVDDDTGAVFEIEVSYQFPVEESEE